MKRFPLEVREAKGQLPWLLAAHIGVTFEFYLFGINTFNVLVAMILMAIIFKAWKNVSIFGDFAKLRESGFVLAIAMIALSLISVFPIDLGRFSFALYWISVIGSAITLSCGFWCWSLLATGTVRFGAARAWAALGVSVVLIECIVAVLDFVVGDDLVDRVNAAQILIKIALLFVHVGLQYHAWAKLGLVVDKRGRCASCGYDLHAMTRDECPECGQDVR